MARLGSACFSSRSLICSRNAVHNPRSLRTSTPRTSLSESPRNFNAMICSKGSIITSRAEAVCRLTVTGPQQPSHLVRAVTSITRLIAVCRMLASLVPIPGHFANGVDDRMGSLVQRLANTIISVLAPQHMAIGIALPTVSFSGEWNVPMAMGRAESVLHAWRNR